MNRPSNTSTPFQFVFSFVSKTGCRLLKRLPVSFLMLQLATSLPSLKAQEKDTIVSNQLSAVAVRSIRATSNAPFAKSEWDKSTLQKINVGVDIPYLLQSAPSAVSFSDAGNGVGYTGLRIRGTDGTRINVTLNGVPVNDAESQGTFFVNFPDLTSSIGSIQLQRGVGSSTNGAGAFGATLSISNAEQSDTASIELNNSIGSFSTIKNTVKLATGLMKHGLQADLRMSRIQSDGYKERAASTLTALQLLTGWKINTATSLRFMYMTGNEKTGQAWNGVLQAQLEGDTAALSRHYQHNINSLYFTSQDSINLFTSDPRRYNYFTYKNQTDNYRQDYYQLFFDHQINKQLHLSLVGFLTRGKGYYEEYKYRQKYADYGISNPVSPSGADTIKRTGLIRQLWLDNYFYGSVFALQYHKNQTQLTLGGALSQYRGRHYGMIKWADKGGISADYEWYRLPSLKNDINTYVKAQHHFNNTWLLFGELQLRHVSYDINGFRKNPDINLQSNYTFFNPKAGITYLIKNTSAEKQKLYLSFALANKEPNRDDYEASPNSKPIHETLYDWEAGYEWNRQHWNISANLYYMQYKNQLILTGKINDVGAYTRTNVPRSYRTGIELQGTIAPSKWLQAGTNITLSENKVMRFTEYIDNWDNGDQEAVYKGNTAIAFSPAIISNSFVILRPFYHLPKAKAFEINLSGKYVGKQYLDNSGNEDRTIKPYFVSDIKLYYATAFHPFKKLEVIAGLNNVFNQRYVSNGYTYAYLLGGTQYTDNYYYPQAGRNWVLSLNMHF